LSDEAPQKPKLPSYFTGNEKKKIRRKSMKQENRVAKAVKGRRQKASGALPGSKGDVRSVELLGECKRTDKKSISITIEYLQKITEEAAYYSKIPSVAIEIESPPKFVNRDWILLPAGFVQELLEVYRGRSS
jgi:hypothetical protein